VNRWLRMVIAAAALVAFGAPLVPLNAAAAYGCACPLRCCSKPSRAVEGCRLSGPCCAGQQDATGLQPGGAFRPAVIDAVIPAAVSPRQVARVAVPSDRFLRSFAEPPPVPPPRSASAR
jgi:hypothetical protein